MTDIEEAVVLDWHTLTRAEVGTVELPSGWSWDPRQYQWMPDGSYVTMYEAVEDDGDGCVFYDGYDYLRMECTDNWEVRQCVIDANGPTIDKVMGAWIAVNSPEKKPAPKVVKKSDKDKFQAFLDDLNELQNQHGIQLERMWQDNDLHGVILSMTKTPNTWTMESTFIGGNWVEVFDDVDT